MHICFASLSYPLDGGTSGVGTQTKTLAQSLVARGYMVSVIILASRFQKAPLDNNGVQVYQTATTNLHWYLGKIPWLGSRLGAPTREVEYGFAVWRALRQIRRTQPLDLIEGTETGMLFAGLGKIPVVIRLHGEQYTFRKYTPGMPLDFALRSSRALQRVALRRAGILQSPSHSHAREIANELGAHRPPIVILPNYVALPDAVCAPSSASAARIVLYVGRIERLKGIPVLVQAAAQVVRKLPDVQFVLAGGFHPTFSRTEFDASLQDACLRGHFTLLGELSQPQLAEWYHRAMVGVLPSYYETFGLAALEQMSFGVPVVATRATGLSEVVQDGVTGILVDRGDADMLADALVRLLEDTNLRTQMGRAAQVAALHFSSQEIAPKNVQVFEWAHSRIHDESGPHVFFSPHLDDVVLSCGGILDTLREHNRSVQVINVFSGQPPAPTLSAFVRHLHAKWGLGNDAVSARSREDAAALEALGVDKPIYWDFLEAPYRCNQNNQPLYASYAELRGDPAVQDRELELAVSRRVTKWLDTMPPNTIVYMPLGLGHHVDHQILFRVGQALERDGKHVRYYQDYPYSEQYETDPSIYNWVPKTVPISLAHKTTAAGKYQSQVRGLGGTPARLAERLAKASRLSSTTQPAEQLWEHTPLDHTPELSAQPVHAPFRRRTPTLSRHDASKILATFRWHDLSELLLPGSGICLDVGCGQGRHRQLIAERGYQWVGLERTADKPGRILGDGEYLPIAAAGVSALVAWQMMEYVMQPEQVVAEAARVLEPGGVFCGSVSFLEPLHGQTLYNLSPLALERLLEKYGFADVEIRAGLNGFALMLWTGLRRSGIPRAEGLAIPLALLLLAAPAFALFLVSWLSWRIGLGGGHTMRWLTERAPLEFAGHVLFSGRKRARPTTCASGS